MRTLTLALSAVAFAFTGTTVATAGPALCGKRIELIKVLKNRYNEERVMVGLSQKSTEAFEVFASEQGTWTVLMTMRTGLTCIMASGHSWKGVRGKGT